MSEILVIMADAYRVLGFLDMVDMVVVLCLDDFAAIGLCCLIMKAACTRLRVKIELEPAVG